MWKFSWWWFRIMGMEMSAVQCPGLCWAVGTLRPGLLKCTHSIFVTFFGSVVKRQARYMCKRETLRQTFLHVNNIESHQQGRHSMFTHKSLQMIMTAKVHSWNLNDSHIIRRHPAWAIKLLFYPFRRDA